MTSRLLEDPEVMAIQMFDARASERTVRGIEVFVRDEEGRAVNPDWPAYRDPAKVAIPGSRARFRGRPDGEPLKPEDGDRDADVDISRL